MQTQSKTLTQFQHRDACVNLLTYPRYWILTDIELAKKWRVNHATVNRWRKRARKLLCDDDGLINVDRRAKMNELVESRMRVLQSRDKNGKRQTRKLNGKEPEIDSISTDGSEKKVPLDKVWFHEDKFTIWLEKNINVLNDVIDLSLSIVGRKQVAGDFIVDLIAKDEYGNLVVIENQLKRSDHDHLGKLITYLTKKDAKAAIWIVKEARHEHIGAISWLNESSSGSFYLIKIGDLVPIRNSLPKPLLTTIVDPSGVKAES